MTRRQHTRRALRLAALVAGILVSAGPAGAQGEKFDHLKCFDVRDDLPERTVLLADLLPLQKPLFMDQRCKVRLPARFFCIEVRKENVLEHGKPRPVFPVASDDAGDYLCYRLRCPRESLSLGAADQFAIRVINTGLSDLLCLPARKLP